MLWVNDTDAITKIKDIIQDALSLVVVIDAGVATAEKASLKEPMTIYRISAEYPVTQHKGCARAVKGRTRQFVVVLDFVNPYIDTTSFEHKLATEEVFLLIDMPEGKRRYPITLSGFSDLSLGKSPNCNNQIALTFTIAE